MLTASNRLLRLLSLLPTRRHWAGADLAAALNIHPRTVRRDIDRLRQLGYPIHASSGVAGGYAFRAGHALPPLMLDDDEALAVAITLQVAATGSVGGIEESALRALVKLEQVMPPRLRQRVDALRSEIVPIDRVGPAVDASRLATLATACRDQLQIEFDYADIRGRTSRRCVDPQGLAHTAQRWYLVAWDLGRDDWRTFRIDRIASEPLVGGHFAPRPLPAGGDLRAYVSRSINVSPYAEQAQIILHAPLDVMVTKLPYAASLLTAMDDARCLLQCGANSYQSLVSWLMALDVDFDVQTPGPLSDHLKTASERLGRSLQRAAHHPKQPS